jgi:hypothetical protein
MSRKKKGGPSDYEIGRGKPPKSHRFKPGQSGNPGGRKRGSLNLKTILDRILLEGQIEVTENGRKRRITKLEAVLLKQVQCAIQGDWRAGEKLIDRHERYAAAEEGGEQELAEEDAILLKRALAARNPRRASGNDDNIVEPSDCFDAGEKKDDSDVR